MDETVTVRSFKEPHFDYYVYTNDSGMSQLPHVFRVKTMRVYYLCYFHVTFPSIICYLIHYSSWSHTSLLLAHILIMEIDVLLTLVSPVSLSDDDPGLLPQRPLTQLHYHETR